MNARSKPRFWRICRIYFRRLRIAIWLVVLLLVGSLVYLNQVGLPGFVKRPLLEKLRERGIDLQFSRLRLRWYDGLVAENVRFGKPDDVLAPFLTLSEVQVQLNRQALGSFQLQVDSLLLKHGRLAWPIPTTNGAPRQLSVEDIQTELRLLPNDEWSLDNFKARFAGANIRLSGAVSNASVVREWDFFHAKHPAPAQAWQNRAGRLADTLERIHFSTPPELSFDIRGDARDPLSFHARLILNTPDAETPWGTVHLGRFTLLVYPSGSNETSQAELNLEAVDAQSPWAATRNMQMTVHMSSLESETNRIKADMALCADWVETRWGSATNAQINVEWVQALTNPVPLIGNGAIQCSAAETLWGNARDLYLSGHLSRSPETNQHADASWSWWANLEPYFLDWKCRLSHLQLTSPQPLSAEFVSFDGGWRAPTLAFTNLHAELYGGKTDAQGKLDIAARKLAATVATDIDPHRFSPLLTEGGRNFIDQFSWNEAPAFVSDIALGLPAWTNQQPDWRAEVQPTLQLQGQFGVYHGGAYRGVPFSQAQGHFVYTNMVWFLPDLLAVRPEGRVQAVHQSSDLTKEFYWRISSTVDPRAIRPLFTTNQQRAFDLFTLGQPPRVEAELWGRWHHPEEIGGRGMIAATNFAFRGETCDFFQSAFSYTNLFLLLTNSQLARGTQHMSADALGLDFPAEKIYLTNGFGSADPGSVCRAIGPNIARIMEPYQFGRPPTAHVHGVIPMRREEDADLYFKVNGGPFHSWKLTVPQISGEIHWVGHRLSLSDVRADFYGGKAMGSASFNFGATNGADYHFAVTATNALMQLLMPDLLSRTSLEGTLSGNLNITKANTANPHELQGSARLELHDGLIWAIPIFGVLSPALDSLVPGLGSSRATAGSGNFTITNAVVRSENLEIRSPAMRLNYRGAVDLEKQVNARVEAELLRDMWVVGPIVSTVLWPVTKLFEYKVTGPLSQPKIEPVYFVPKVVLMPFHPFRTFRELLPENTPLTNAPPIFENIR